MIHDRARVEAIRARAKAQLDIITSMEAMIAKGRFEALDVARNQTGDIEAFLEYLERQSRTPEEEASWLSFAEQMLGTWAPYLKKINEQFTALGGAGIEIVGG